MRKYVIGFVAAAMVFGAWELYQYVTRLETEAATAHEQSRQVYTFLAQVVRPEAEKQPALTRADVLASIVQAQLTAQEAQK